MDSNKKTNKTKINPFEVVLTFVAIASLISSIYISNRQHEASNEQYLELKNDAQQSSKKQAETDSIRFYTQLDLLAEQLKLDSIYNNRKISQDQYFFQKRLNLQSRLINDQRTHFEEQMKQQKQLSDLQLSEQRQVFESERQLRLKELEYYQVLAEQNEIDTRIKIESIYSSEFRTIKLLKSDISQNILPTVSVFKRSAERILFLADSIRSYHFLKPTTPREKTLRGYALDALPDLGLGLAKIKTEISPGSSDYTKVSALIEGDLFDFRNIYEQDLQRILNLNFQEVVQSLANNLDYLLYWTEDFGMELEKKGYSEKRVKDILLEPKDYQYYLKILWKSNDSFDELNSILDGLSSFETTCLDLLLKANSIEKSFYEKYKTSTKLSN